MEEADSVKECYECGRRGSRGFIAALFGKHVGEMRCLSVRACEERKYRKWMGYR